MLFRPNKPYAGDIADQMGTEIASGIFENEPSPSRGGMMRLEISRLQTSGTP